MTDIPQFDNMFIRYEQRKRSDGEIPQKIAERPKTYKKNHFPDVSLQLSYINPAPSPIVSKESLHRNSITSNSGDQSALQLLKEALDTKTPKDPVLYQLNPEKNFKQNK